MTLSLLVSAALAAPQVAVVVVDLEAREEGYALALEDLVFEDALPVDVVEGDRVMVVDPDGGRHPLDVAPGEAWVVSGPEGEAWMARIGEEIRTDVLLVRGDADAVRGFAEAMGAEVRIDEDQVWLVGRDLLFQAPWAEARGLHRLDDVAFVPVGREPPPGAVAAVDPAVGGSRRSVSAPARVLLDRSPDAVRGSEGEARVLEVTPAPEPEAPIEEEVRSERDPLDPGPYVGLYHCADGQPLALQPGGTFAVAGGSGDWSVSAPGVVHLHLAGGGGLRAAIETDRHYCRAVW